jgi:asparagine synthase (glutamine-hydrolysing)
MCGFAAFFSNKQSKKNKIFLKEAQNMMQHRGPDASEVWISSDDNVGLCHNRLSIIDLTKAANQPLWNSSGNLLIVFNGEIYNHKQLRLDLEKKGWIFKTHSDTEVILVLFEEFGEKFVSMLVGMFSFCIYDHVNKIVFGARDVSGEKPLYYLHTETTIYFSSEFRPLQKLSLALGKNSIDKKNLAKILTTGFVCSDGTINFNIKKIKPGHTFKYNLEDNHFSTSQYFNVNKLSLCKPIYISEAKQKFTKVFSEVVKNQLDADVEVGVLLSGGIDSSLVTAFASQYREKVRTYSVSLQGNELYDESKYAKQIADFFKTEHVEINLKDLSLNDFKAVIDSVDDPVIDSSFIPTYLIMREIKKHQKVVLGGDGADELFGGYKHYKRLSYIHFFQRYIPDQILKTLLSQIEKHFPLGKKGSNWLRSIVRPLDKIPPLVNPIFDHSQIFDITNKKVNIPINFACDIQRHQINHKDLIGSFMKYDFNNYLPEDLFESLREIVFLSKIKRNDLIIEALQSLVKTFPRK